jgi:type II secretory pathway component PulJ
MLSDPRVRQSGMGLVELMISIALGLVIAAGVGSMFVGTAASNARLVQTVRLDQELHAVMDLMLRDLRRAGSHGRPALLATGIANPFALDGVSAYPGEASSSCITFSYDLDQDGTLDTAAGDERFGFRLHAQTVQMRRGGLPCTSSASPNWETVTDIGLTRITALQFAVSQATAGAMSVRAVRITISGKPVGDENIARTLVREVRVRNDLYAP